MQGTEKQLTQLLANKRIDAFIRQYEDKGQKAKGTIDSGLKAEYEKWRAKITQIDGLLKQQIDTRKWISHSTRQVTTSINRSANKFQIKCKLSLHQGYENLHRLVANPKTIHQLLPFCQQMIELKTYSDLEKDILLKFKVPIISERYMASHLLLLDRLQEKDTIVIFGEEIKSEEAAKLAPKDNLIKVKAFICQVRIGVGEYLISSYAHLDGPLSLIPDFVLKKILYLANTVLISNISKAVNKTKSSIDPSNLEQRLRLRYMGRL